MVDRLDVNTPKGQETILQELDAVRIFQRHFPEKLYLHTPKKSDAKLDGVVITNEAELDGVVETKCRNMTLHQLQKWDCEWLLTYTKLEHGRTVSDLLKVPFYGFLYLVPDKKLLVQKLYDPITEKFVKFRTDNTRTQATVNGGSTVRNNAFIDMSKAEIFE